MIVYAKCKNRQCRCESSRELDNFNELPRDYRCRECLAEHDVEGLDRVGGRLWYRLKLVRNDEDHG